MRHHVQKGIVPRNDRTEKDSANTDGVCTFDNETPRTQQKPQAPSKSRNSMPQAAETVHYK
jgi:hypothetical protein